MRCAWLLLGLLVVGCNKPPAPTGTDAGVVAQDYFTALVRQDWPEAYAKLHPEAQARWQPAGFTRAAQNFCRGLSMNRRRSTLVRAKNTAPKRSRICC